MIAYLEGTIKFKMADRIILLASQVGYEVLIPAFVMDTLADTPVGAELALFIFFQQTERQPCPVLIGFRDERQKAFFQHFISVDTIGPLKAIKALTQPVEEIAHHIESKNIPKLKALNGIGPRVAEKIVAALCGKMTEFLGEKPVVETVGMPAGPATADPGMVRRVLDVLVGQLGHRPGDAKRMIQAALEKNPAITQAEALIDAIYQGEANRS